MNVPAQDDTVLLIEDGNALFHSMKEIPCNFSQISEKQFNMTSQKVDVIFSTDMYKEYSVKSMERNRRESIEKLLLQGENTKKPADWKKLQIGSDQEMAQSETNSHSIIRGVGKTKKTLKHPHHENMPQAE